MGGESNPESPTEEEGAPASTQEGNSADSFYGKGSMTAWLDPLQTSSWIRDSGERSTKTGMRPANQINQTMNNMKGETITAGSPDGTCKTASNVDSATGGRVEGILGRTS